MIGLLDAVLKIAGVHFVNILSVTKVAITFCYATSKCVTDTIQGTEGRLLASPALLDIHQHVKYELLKKKGKYE